MSEANFVQNNFTAGELSPKLALRNDIKKYFQGVKTLENFILFPQGGITRSPGLRFVKEVKDSTKKTRLVPFVFSTTQAYILEFGNQYIRVYKDNGRIESGGNPVEISSPYLEADLFDLQFIQSADTLYIVHQNYEPRKLTRSSHTNWTLRVIDFKQPPTHETDTDISSTNTTLTRSADTGTGVTFTASNAVFLAGDKGRFIVVGDALAEITAITSTTVATAKVLYSFAGLANPTPDGSWFLRGSPNSVLYVNYANPVERKVIITSYDPDATASVQNTFRSADIGKFIKIWGGVILIETYTNATSVIGRLLSELNAPQVPGAPIIDGDFKSPFTLEVLSWTSTFGYPGAISFFEGRLWFAGSTTFPYRLWSSKTNDFENITIGYLDDDAVEYNVFNNQVNNILWLFPTDSLFMGTLAGEFRATGGNDNPLTPDNVLIKNISSMGSKRIKPVQVFNSILFIQRSGKKLLETAYNFDADSYLPNDLNLLADHLFKDYTIVDMAYQQEPDKIVWVVRSDGILCGLTLDRFNDVIGWHRRITQNTQIAQFESVAVIPHPDGTDNQVWVIVRRLINGTWKRYVEYFSKKSTVIPDNDLFYNQMNVDSGLTYSGSPTNTVTGLSHLEGAFVHIVGDGAVYPGKTVTSGQITLDGNAARNIEIGLPYTSKLETMRPELADRSIYNKLKRWKKLTISLLETLGLSIGITGGTYDIPFRKGSDPMDAPPSIFTGDKDIDGNIAWSKDAKITIQQLQPLPCTILGFVGYLDIGD